MNQIDAMAERLMEEIKSMNEDFVVRIDYSSGNLKILGSNKKEILDRFKSLLEEMMTVCLGHFQERDGRYVFEFGFDSDIFLYDYLPDIKTI